MTLPNYVLGTVVHLFDGVDCVSARIVARESLTTATLNLDVYDVATKNGADRHNTGLQRPNVPFDPNPLAPARDTFHLAGACPWLR